MCLLYLDHRRVKAIFMSASTVERRELVTESIACAIEILEAVETVRTLESAIAERTRSADRRYRHIQELGRSLISTLERRGAREAGDLAALADRIRQVASEEVADEVRRIRERFEHDIDSARAEIAACGDRWRATLESLMLRRDLPGSTGRIAIALGDGGDYTARLFVHNDAGLGADIELGIPADSIWAAGVRVGDVAGRLRVAVPSRSWLLRRERVSRKSLMRYTVAGLVHNADGTLLHLRRGALDDDRGFDVHYGANRGEIAVSTTGGAEPLPDHAASVDDCDALRTLRNALLDHAIPLVDDRRSIRRATLDAVPVDELDSPEVIAARIVRAIADTASESDLSVADVQKQIAHLRGPSRRVFAALGADAASTPPTPVRPSKARSASEIDRAWDLTPGPVA